MSVRTSKVPIFRLSPSSSRSLRDRPSALPPRLLRRLRDDGLRRPLHDHRGVSRRLPVRACVALGTALGYALIAGSPAAYRASRRPRPWSSSGLGIQNWRAGGDGAAVLQASNVMLIVFLSTVFVVVLLRAPRLQPPLRGGREGARGPALHADPQPHEHGALLAACGLGVLERALPSLGRTTCPSESRCSTGQRTCPTLPTRTCFPAASRRSG